eukprot:GFKZ01015024.1.p1 GENE.GFKZ01015024.1~~GFKZ01015024.1.p1  ORF type:complete len:554 (+),score=53.05 GFKZ01015024.1:336-1997(+)
MIIRRRMAVEKRDPIARQRQFFARRREERNRLNPLPPRDRINARKYLDAFRQGNYPTPEASAQNQAANRIAKQFKGDLLFLAPQALETVASDLAALHRQRQGDSAIERGQDREQVVHEDEKGGPGQPHKLNESNDLMSNEIRIFNEHEERTPRYRAPVLPKHFLNSHNTQPIQDAPSSKRRRRLTGYNASSSQEDSRKRRKGHNCGPPLRASITPPQVSDWISPPSIPEDQSRYLQPVQKDRASRNPTRVFRVPSRSPSPRPLKTRLLQIEQTEPSRHGSVSQIQDYCRPPEYVNRNVTRHYHFDRPLSPPCGSKGSNLQDNRAVPIEQSRSNYKGNSEEEIPRSRYLEISCDNSCTSALPPVEDEGVKGAPILRQADFAKVGSILRKFPPIQIDSESDNSSNAEPENEAAPYMFQSILSQEPFHLDQVSAEVLRIEREMLNDPDYTVSLFSAPPQRPKPSSRVLGVSVLSNAEPAGTGRQTSEYNNPVLGKENVVPEETEPESRFRSAELETNAPTAPSAMLGMEIVISPSTPNPLENTPSQEDTLSQTQAQ